MGPFLLDKRNNHRIKDRNHRIPVVRPRNLATATVPQALGLAQDKMAAVLEMVAPEAAVPGVVDQVVAARAAVHPAPAVVPLVVAELRAMGAKAITTVAMAAIAKAAMVVVPVVAGPAVVDLAAAGRTEFLWGVEMRVLIVEDHRSLSQQMATALRDAGYVAEHSHEGEDALFRGSNEPFDAIILDLGLPQLDGLSILQKWRADNNRIPVIIVTARDSWMEKVRGLRAGADDYVTKPFQMEELIARIEALIRRSHGLARPVLTCGDVMVDTTAGTVTLNGRSVLLTALEYRLLSYLMHRQDVIVSKTELTEHIYDQSFDRDSNVIEVLVNRLRKKLSADLIKTKRGLGYVIGATAEEQSSLATDGRLRRRS
jgi:two-component system OmpR family response regulator